MAKPPRNPPPPPAGSGSSLLPTLLVGLIGLLIGGTGTYLVLAPRLRPATPPAGAAAPAADPSAHLPPPALTAGQSPAQAARTLGNFHYDHQNWPLAIQHYETAIRQGSDDADIRTDLGNAYRFTGRAEEALHQYQAAQKMNPAHEFSLFNQGGLYLELFRDPAKAIAAWQDYLARFPNGRSAAAARQLLAQARGGSTLPSPAAPPSEPGSGSEDLILRSIQAAQTAKPRP